MRLYIRITAFLLATLMVLLGAAGCAAQLDPLQYVKKSVIRTLERRLDSNSIFDILSLLWDGGSISASFDAAGLTDHPVSSMGAELFIAPEGVGISGSGSLGVDGKSYDAAFWLTEKELAFSSQAFLGSDTFGFHTDRLGDQLPKSIFASNSGTDYANQKMNGSAPAAIDVCFDKTFFLLQAKEEYKDIAEDVLDEFLDALQEHTPAQRYAHDGKIYVNLQLNNESISRAVRDAWGELVDSRRFCKRLRSYADAMDAMLSAREGITLSTYRNELDLWLNHNTNIEELCAKIDAHEPFLIDLNVVVRRTAGQIETFSLYYTAESARHGVFVDLTDDSGLTASLTHKGKTLDIGYTVEKNGLRTYRAAMQAKLSSEGTEAVTRYDGVLELDRFKKGVSLTLQRGEHTAVLTGSFDVGLDSFELELDRLRRGDTEHTISFTLAVDAGKKKVEMPQYRDLFTLEISRMDTVWARYTESRAAFDASLAGVYPTTPAAVTDCFLDVLGMK